MTTAEAKIEALIAEMDEVMPVAYPHSAAAARLEAIYDELRALGVEWEVWD